jgi:hypothetical protein
MAEPLVSFAFEGEIIEWRGPAPFLFVPIPEDLVGEVRYAAQQTSYGWGVVPVRATIGGTAFTTSLFPRNGGYLLPIKLVVQKREAIGLGDRIEATIHVESRSTTAPGR